MVHRWLFFSVDLKSVLQSHLRLEENISYPIKPTVFRDQQELHLVEADIYRLETYILEEEYWTVERLILISGLVSKAYNLGSQPLHELKECISEKRLGANIVNLLATSLLPKQNQMTCALHPVDKAFFNDQTSYPPKLLGMERAKKLVQDLVGNEKADQGCFHHIRLDSISPVVLNMFIPMGLERVKGVGSMGDQYSRCPFAIAGLNHRVRNDQMEQKILGNLFSEEPSYNMTDMYAVIGLSKTPTRQMRGEEQKYAIPLQNYLSHKKDLLLLGDDECEIRMEDVGNLKKCFGSYPLCPDKEGQQSVTTTEVQNMYKTLDQVPRSMVDSLTTPKDGFVVRGAELDKDFLAPTHWHLSLFKTRLQRKIMEYTVEYTKHGEDEEISHEVKYNDPVQVMTRLAKFMREQGGVCFKPFFKCLDNDEGKPPSDGKTCLPLVTHICKVLFQGRTALMDQGLEGNHRLAVQAAILSGSLSDLHMKVIVGKALKISLLFAHGFVLQMVPNISSIVDITELYKDKVRPVFFCEAFTFFFV
jgi:hypothetical protein